MTTLLSALAQASWQGMVFAVLVGAACLLRIPAGGRATLWVLVGVKFVGGFLFAVCFGERAGIGVTVPALFLPSVAANVLGAAWVGGVVIGAVLLLLRLWEAARRVRAASPVVSPSLDCLLTELAARASPSLQPPPVRIAPAGTAAQVTICGTTPVILLPVDLLPPAATALETPDLRLLLAHELAHIRRGDLWTAWLFAASQTLFFFHPGAAWAKREWEAAREEACDLLALQIAGTENEPLAARYGALLLRLGTTTDERGAVGAAFLAASPFAVLRRRIRHLEGAQAAPGSVGTFGAAAVVAVFVALLLPLRPLAPVPVPATLPVVVAASPAPVVKSKPVVASVPLPTLPPPVVRVAAPRWVTARVAPPRQKQKPAPRVTRPRLAPPVVANQRFAPALARVAPPELAPMDSTVDAPVAAFAAPVAVTPDMKTVVVNDTMPVAMSDGASDSVAVRPNDAPTPVEPALRSGETVASPVRTSGRASQTVPQTPEAKPRPAEPDVPPLRPQ